MADQTDMKAHVADYDKMIAMLKWGALGVAIIAAGVIWLIA